MKEKHVNKRQENELTNRMERLVATGTVRFEWWELYAWYEQSRLSKSIYRDLIDRYEAASGDSTLKYLELREGFLLLETKGIKELSDLA